MSGWVRVQAKCLKRSPARLGMRRPLRFRPSRLRGKVPSRRMVSRAAELGGNPDWVMSGVSDGIGRLQHQLVHVVFVPVDACSISHKGGSKLRKRLSSAEEMSARRFDVKPDQSGLSQSQHPPQRRNQNASSGRAYEMTAGRELGGSGSHHAQLLHQMSIPSNVAIDISSRGGRFLT